MFSFFLFFVFFAIYQIDLEIEDCSFSYDTCSCKKLQARFNIHFLFHDSTAMLPVRWMSPESIREGLFTPCTDVWSYGVTLWELSTIGGFPYQGMSNAEVLERVEKGYTLEIPNQFSQEMYVSSLISYRDCGCLVVRSPFLQSPGNLAGPRPCFKIKFKGYKSRFCSPNPSILFL